MLKRVLLIGPILVIAIFALPIIFGGPGTPHPMGSIIDPFNSVDFSDLPQLSRFTARDGTKLAYRSHAPAGQGTARCGVYDLCAGHPRPWWFRPQGADRLYRTVGRRSH